MKGNTMSNVPDLGAIKQANEALAAAGGEPESEEWVSEITFEDVVALQLATVMFLTEAFGPVGGARIAQLYDEQVAKIIEANKEESE